MIQDGFYNMDCFDGFRLIDDKSIDMILCPTGQQIANGIYRFRLISYGSSTSGLLRTMEQLYCFRHNRLQQI